MASSRDATSELRRAIAALPVRTRQAMLDGIRANPIVAGAYTDSAGGICPMLAAHRHGGRTTLLSFARAWDRFAGARRVRRASVRELATLERILVTSLATPAPPASDLGAAIDDHAALVEARFRRGRTFPELRAGRLREPGAERALARLDVHVLAAQDELAALPAV